MPSNRYYLPQPFSVGETEKLFEREFHHLIHVMRKKRGDRLELINGKGQLAQGILKDFDRNGAAILIESIETSLPKLPPFILIQALLTPTSLKWTVQKGTELGVKEFLFFPAIHSERERLPSNALEKLNQIAIGALKQCGRLDLPRIAFFPTLEEVTAPFKTLYFGDVREKAPLFTESLPFFSNTLVIGPEKGLSSKEISFLEETRSAHGVKLHPYVLRAETASIVGVILGLLTHPQRQLP